MSIPDVYASSTNTMLRIPPMRVTKIAAFLMLVLPVAANAQVINQNQSVSPLTIANFSQTDLAQSFKQSVGNIVGAGVFLTRGSAAETLTIELWDKLPNVSGAMQLATGSTAINGSNVWADVFWAQTNITAGQTYFLRFLSSNNFSLYGIGGSIDDPYADGQVYANPGYGSFSNFDYAFRTYETNGLAVVPEPATYVLMVSGLAMLVGTGVIRRRRQA